MKQTRIVQLIVLLLLLLIGCNFSGQKKNNASSESIGKEEKAGQQVGFPELVPSVFRIDTYDKNRILETGIGFFVSGDLAVTRLSFFTSANRAIIEPFDEEKTYTVAGFLAFDRSNDLILLKIEGLSKNPVTLSDSILHDKEKTVYFNKPQGNTVPLHEGEVVNYGTILGSKLYKLTNQMRSKSTGSPVFNTKMECIGLAFMKIEDYETQTFATPAAFISDLIKKGGEVKPLSSLNPPVANPDKPMNTKVKGLVIETDMGDITIKLYDSTPQYRDNFVKLVLEGYYDAGWHRRRDRA
jgi:S1-C subfamily serine protease